MGVLLVTDLAIAADLEFSKAWVRAPIGQSNMTAGYLVIDNKGEKEDRLLSVQSDVAAKIELHQNNNGEGGVMRMRPVDDLQIPAGKSVSFRSGADHLMLSGIETPLKVGDFINLTLTFKLAGDIVVPAQVLRRNPYP
ncbi:MAG: copper chaperone PCu(A)C [Rhodospirillaceae bacterium]|nr:copper chaperone PCu(A)C [Rhodospirillaceae bacterium]